MSLIEAGLIRNPFRLSRLMRSARQRLVLWRTRRALADLEPHLLEDIGVARGAALEEARRPLWDVPDSWVRR